jgi:hypothetical protein
VNTPLADPPADVDTSEPGFEEVVAVARGMATAVAPASGITEVQAALLGAVTKAVTGFAIDYRTLEPLGPDELARVLAHRGPSYRQRIVHHMVLGELVLAPVPADVAQRVAACADALGITDDFVQIARKYAKGALGLAWNDLRRSGFTERWESDPSRMDALHSKAAVDDPFDEGFVDPELEARWAAFAELEPGSLGHQVNEMYRQRGFQLPGSRGAASAALAQHDFIHVLSDYGTTMEGELEVFALAGRADPDPKGFAWLATMIGLFETGAVQQQGFFESNVRERHLDTPGMDVRLADALRRGKVIAEQLGKDLFTIDYHVLAPRQVDEVRVELHIPPKSPDAVAAGSVGLFDPEGMSEYQREAGRRMAAGEATGH